MFKVRREGLKTLCDTCAHAQIITDNRGDSEVICNYPAKGMRLTKPIIECSKYCDSRQPTKYEMEDHAWLLITEARHGNIVGFVSPKQRKKEHKEVEDY